MAAHAPSFFKGFSVEERAAALEGLRRRRFPAGSVVVAEGEHPREMYVVEAGTADVLVKDQQGMERRVGQIGPGAPIGEMVLLAAGPDASPGASATVRATSVLDVVVLDADDFARLASAYPRLLQNLGAILSQRLARIYEHELKIEHGRVTALLDHGAPPLLGYALACSMAWHSRRSTLLVVVTDDAPDVLRSLASAAEAAHDHAVHHASHGHNLQAVSLTAADGRARLLLAPPGGEFSPGALDGTLDRLSHSFEQVLVQVRRQTPPGFDGRMVRLTDTTALLPDGSLGQPGHTIRGWATGNPYPRPDRTGVLHVPPLQAADERALADGVLPSGTPAGRALGWAARDLCGLKVGLVLGAGSIKGYAHYGVLRALERIGLSADYVTGSSIGAIIAATYALGFTADEAARNMEETSWRAFRPTLPTRALLSNAGVHFNFRKVAGDRRIEDLEVPLAIVAADIVSGQEVVFRRGLLRTAALASMAIPGIYPPLRMGEHVLVDGGVINPMPINVAASMGADVVVAIKLSQGSGRPAPDAEAGEDEGRLPSLLQTITRSVEMMQSRISANAATAATVLIEPDVRTIPGLGLHAFHQGRPYIAPGEQATLDALPRLTAALPWLRD